MAQGDGISKKSERKIRTMKRILVISWYFPPINSSEGLVTYKLLKNSKYQYDVCMQDSNDSWSYGDISSYNKIGERAVAIARSRLNWSYSQAKRTLEGSWDCSSMVARCYQEAGFDLKAIMGAQWCMTTVGWKDFAMKNKQFIEENKKETLAQVFTDVRYIKKDNEFMSENLLKVLRQQGF